MYEIRAADRADVPPLLAMMEDFNGVESIEFHRDRCEAALIRLLEDAVLGFVLIASVSDRMLGYAVITYNYDLEFGGRDAFVTELYVQPGERRAGLGRALVRAITERGRREHLTSLHLAVRPENRAALDLYLSEGYERVPRLWMTKLLIS